MTPTATLAEQFTYHPPTDETAPKYAAIREAADRCIEVIAGNAEHSYDVINTVTRAFAEAIMEHAPRCADRTAAIRNVRLARMVANEVASYVQQGRRMPDVIQDAMADKFSLTILEARWWACSAIALDGANLES